MELFTGDIDLSLVAFRSVLVVGVVALLLSVFFNSHKWTTPSLDGEGDPQGRRARKQSERETFRRMREDRKKERGSHA